MLCPLRRLSVRFSSSMPIGRAGSVSIGQFDANPLIVGEFVAHDSPSITTAEQGSKLKESPVWLARAGPQASAMGFDD